jgi:hypothetical protein
MAEGRATLEALRLDSGSYCLLATSRGDVKPRIGPFGAIELDLLALWSK